jgi:hypothetical protein
MTRTIEQIETEARQIAARPGATETKEQAFTRLLEMEPAAYENFVARHNAQGMLATLEKAGIKFSGLRAR